MKLCRRDIKGDILKACRQVNHYTLAKIHNNVKREQHIKV